MYAHEQPINKNGSKREKTPLIGTKAFSKGSDIHGAPKQESAIRHESGHIVQQKQGRVNPIARFEGVDKNDDLAIEQKADVIVQKVARYYPDTEGEYIQFLKTTQYSNVIQGKFGEVVQRAAFWETDNTYKVENPKPTPTIPVNKPYYANLDGNQNNRMYNDDPTAKNSAATATGVSFAILSGGAGEAGVTGAGAQFDITAAAAAVRASLNLPVAARAALANAEVHYDVAKRAMLALSKDEKRDPKNITMANYKAAHADFQEKKDAASKAQRIVNDSDSVALGSADDYYNRFVGANVGNAITSQQNAINNKIEALGIDHNPAAIPQIDNIAKTVSGSLSAPDAKVHHAQHSLLDNARGGDYYYFGFNKIQDALIPTNFTYKVIQDTPVLVKHTGHTEITLDKHNDNGVKVGTLNKPPHWHAARTNEEKNDVGIAGTPQVQPLYSNVGTIDHYFTKF